MGKLRWFHFAIIITSLVRQTNAKETSTELGNLDESSTVSAHLITQADKMETSNIETTTQFYDESQTPNDVLDKRKIVTEIAAEVGVQIRTKQSKNFVNASTTPLPTDTDEIPMDYYISDNSSLPEYESDAITIDIYDEISNETRNESTLTRNPTSYKSLKNKINTENTVSPDSNQTLLDHKKFLEKNFIRRIGNINGTESDYELDLSAFDEENLNCSHQHVNDFARIKNHILIMLGRDCTNSTQFYNSLVHKQMMMQITETIDIEDKNTNSASCAMFMIMRFPVPNVSNKKLEAFIKTLPKNIRLENVNYTVVKSFVVNADFSIGDMSEILINAKRRDDFLNREIVAYIIAAVCVFLLFMTFLIFCCIRCANHRQTNSLDLSDIPHINLKLEDYKITSIPRPSISYRDYGSELMNNSYGHYHSSDDIMLSQHHFTGSSPSPFQSTLQPDTMSKPHEMKTFNGRRNGSRVQSMDIRPSSRDYDSWLSNSQEKLNSDHDRRTLNGFDNAGFRKWF